MRRGWTGGAGGADAGGAGGAGVYVRCEGDECGA